MSACSWSISHIAAFTSNQQSHSTVQIIAWYGTSAIFISCRATEVSLWSFQEPRRLRCCGRQLVQPYGREACRNDSARCGWLIPRQTFSVSNTVDAPSTIKPLFKSRQLVKMNMLEALILPAEILPLRNNSRRPRNGRVSWSSRLLSRRGREPTLQLPSRLSHAIVSTRLQIQKRKQRLILLVSRISRFTLPWSEKGNVIIAKTVKSPPSLEKTAWKMLLCQLTVVVWKDREPRYYSAVRF